MKSKVTYDIQKNHFGNWNLIKIVETNFGNHGGIQSYPVFQGTKKECEEKKKELMKVERTDKGIGRKNRTTKKRISAKK